MKLILLAVAIAELLPYLLLLPGALLVLGAYKHLKRDNRIREQHKASVAREMAYRADVEDLEWLLAGSYEGQFPTPTMPLTRRNPVGR